MQLPIVFNNRYELNKKLGEGGLAEVFLGQDLALGRMVAAKLLRTEYTTDPAFLVRFHREAQSAASLNNSNTVSVYDFGQDHNRPYIVMEYVSGKDLRTTLDRGLLTVPQIIEYTLQICSAVGMAHRRGMVHGDLKPGNILVSPENRAKVTDFGLARALGESAMDDGELVWGTPAYFAPEQAAGDRVLPATDVYAIGIMLYEMLTGTVPFSGDSDQEIARKQLYEHPPAMAAHTQRIPPELEAIVLRALAKEPARRYHSADQLKQALLDFKQNSTRTVTPVSSPARQAAPAPPAVSLFDWPGILLGIVAVVAVLGLIPLWIGVYNAYANQAPAQPTPVPTLSPGHARVPILVGFSQDKAEATLSGIGLKLEVNSYETHPTIETLSVIRQSVPAGATIPLGGTVYVTLSRGQDLIETPIVLGLPVFEAQRKLREVGLVANAHEVWSLDSPGTVLAQDPEGNTLLSTQTEVNLTVSGGTKIAAGTNFDNQILLSAYELPSINYAHSGIIPITLFWQALRPPRGNYEILIQLASSDDVILAEYRSKPVSGSNPTLNWRTSQQITDPYQLIIPDNLSPGIYQLRLALLNPAESKKLPIISTGSLEKSLGTLILQEIHVN